MTSEPLSLEALVKPHPKQKEFLEAARTHQYTLYGGAAGGGKSFILRWWCILRLLKHAQNGLRGVRIGLLCEDYPSLNDRHIAKVRYEFPDWLGSMHEQSHEFRLRPEFGSGVLAFRNLDDPSKYLSVEFADVAIDELCRDPLETFLHLNMRRRWPGVTDSKFVGATNPGGVGHAWVKRLWIDREFTDEFAAFNPEDFAFVQARAVDNPSLSPNYVSQFISEYDRRVYLDGDWNVFAGQFFTDWRERLHVVQPFEIPREWPKWRAVDYGTLNPFACLWLATDPSTGRRYVYRELYAKGLIASRQAQFIREASGNEAISYTVADPSMFNKSGADGKSPADYYLQEGIVLLKGYNQRVPGWNNVRQALALKEDGLPGLQVFSTCKNLIRTLPSLVHDDKQPEDVDTEQEDHAADALRYGVSPATLPGMSRGTTRRRSPWGVVRAVAQ